MPKKTDTLQQQFPNSGHDLISVKLVGLKSVTNVLWQYKEGTVLYQKAMLEFTALYYWHDFSLENPAS